MRHGTGSAPQLELLHGGGSIEHCTAHAGARHARTPRRPTGTRDDDRRAPAARPSARASLSPWERAARRPRPGRVARPDQGRRPLRPRARPQLLDVRPADDRRRAAAALPRHRLGRPRRARHAGACAEGALRRRGDRIGNRQSADAAPARRAHRREPRGRGRGARRALQPHGAVRSRRRPADTTTAAATRRSPTRSAATTTATTAPRRAHCSARPSDACPSASSGSCGCASSRT